MNVNGEQAIQNNAHQKDPWLDYLGPALVST